MFGFEGTDQYKPADDDDCGTHELRLCAEFRSLHDLNDMLFYNLVFNANDVQIPQTNFILPSKAKS